MTKNLTNRCEGNVTRVAKFIMIDHKLCIFERQGIYWIPINAI